MECTAYCWWIRCIKVLERKTQKFSWHTFYYGSLHWRFACILSLPFYLHDKCTFQAYFNFFRFIFVKKKRGTFSPSASVRAYDTKRNRVKDRIKWMETTSVIFLHWMPTSFILMEDQRWAKASERERARMMKLKRERGKSQKWERIQIDHDLCRTPFARNRC